MTTEKPGDRSTLVDPRVADTWRDASGEEPPESLDAAILAAARREVSTRPEPLAAWEAREARAARRRWWPLAAAATVAAIAVGVLQVTPTDKLGEPATESAIVSDVPAPPAKPETAAKPATDEKPDVAATPAPQAGAATPVPMEERKIVSGDDGGIRSDVSRKDSPRQAAPSRAAPAAPPDAQSFGQPTAPPSAQPTPPPAPAPDPFPAAPKVTPESAPSANGEVGASRAERAAPAAAAAPAATPPPVPAPLAKMGAGRAADSASDDARARERASLPVADWIALIRRLRTEGKQAEAAKELVAFRAAHPDHEKLLPPDLRDWRPAEK